MAGGSSQPRPTHSGTAPQAAEIRNQRSRDKAAPLERDAARKHIEIVSALSQEKSVLEKKIDELRTFRS